VKTVSELRTHCDLVRASGRRVALVPTMGALHDGHLSLIRLAREQADEVVVSIFVNPTQFGPNEDYERYPRTLEMDRELAAEAGAHVLFVPQVAAMYPAGEKTRVVVADLTRHLCGASRGPEHFAGVATIVTKLFAIVGPCVAFFGRKDYQQLRVIERMVSDLLLPVRVVPCPTVRESDGLALSSRNRYLDATWRARAAAIPRALSIAHAAFSSGERSARILRSLVRAELEEQSLALDYVELAEPMELEPVPDEAQVPPRVLLAVAARAGETRLIDNVMLGEEPAPVGQLGGAVLTSGGAA
jgi:pantoate--beta-alanine ligase